MAYKNIIFIDNDEEDRMIFKDTLFHLYPRIIYNDFSGADEVLDYLSHDFIILPDLVFLDINMPGKDGFHVLKSLKKSERLKEIPVIMFSTSSEKNDMQKASKLGALGYAVKPSLLSDLEKIMDVAINKLVYSSEPSQYIIRLHD